MPNVYEILYCALTKILQVFGTVLKQQTRYCIFLTGTLMVLVESAVQHIAPKSFTMNPCVLWVGGGVISERKKNVSI